MGGGGYMIKREYSRTMVKRHGNHRTRRIPGITCIQLDWNVTFEIGARKQETGKEKMGRQVLIRVAGGLLMDMCSAPLVLIMGFK